MQPHATIALLDREDDGVDPAFRSDVLKGLSEPQKAVPARWLYDLAGSELFEDITRLPEYYPTRAETALLRRHGADVARLTGPGRAVVEFGSGSSTKTPLLLGEVDAAAYLPVDISGDFLEQSAAQLSGGFPDLPVIPIEADFMRPVPLPPQVSGLPPLGFFPGSTIGNMVPRTAVDLLRSMRETLGRGAHLLIGFDRVKPVHRLIAAYDDAQGITARFNLNLLERINRELGGDIPVDWFRHVARWNEDWSRIEMHLEATADVDFRVGPSRFSMQRGETIHTENSHKYTPDQARLMLQASGWSPCALWTDDAGDFMLLLAEATALRSAP
ncbi:MAG: L-histidine N(alpha)-methyltransferase [Sphingobium sp.]